MDNKYTLEENMRMLGLLQDPSVDTVDNSQITKGFTPEQKQQAMNFISKEPEPTVVEKGVNAVKNLLTSKESSKTVSKTQNQMEKPKQAKPKMDTATAQDVFKDVTVPETQEGIAKSAEDKSMWSKALDMFDIGPKQAKELWDEVPNPLDRVDLLTTLTVYAASRYSGNNSGLALANGLMRGMESKAKQNQMAQMIAANQAEANQQKIDNAFKDREVSAKEMSAKADLLTAESKGNKPTAALTGDEVKMISATAEAMGLGAEAANSVGSYLKEKNLPFTQINIRKVANAMKAKGLISDNLFRDDTLLVE